MRNFYEVELYYACNILKNAKRKFPCRMIAEGELGFS